MIFNPTNVAEIFVKCTVYKKNSFRNCMFFFTDSIKNQCYFFHLRVSLQADFHPRKNFNPE